MKQKGILITLAASLLLVGSAAIARAEVKDTDFKAAMDKYLQTEEGQKSLGEAFKAYMMKEQENMRKQQGEMAKKREEQAAQEVENQFKNPAKMDIGDSPVKGPKNAKVTIVEFTDFQCPYCKRGNETMDAVMKKYPNDVKVVYKSFPLDFHPNALPAAKAAMAAGKQGKFWEMHDAFWANQTGLNADLYLEQAKKLGLNIDKFKKDMESEEIKKAIEADMELGKKNGISGTPGFFVNGVAVKGAYPVEHFSKIVDRWLSPDPTKAPAAPAPAAPAAPAAK